MQTVLWWHLHQPDYRDPGGATARLPWVRMHALRAYTDLCAFALDEDLRGMTINIVPSLADQLADIASGACEDRHHALARRVVEGDDSALEAAFVSHAVGTPRPLVPLPRFDELRSKAQAHHRPSLDDTTDACALFHLSWVGFTLGARPEIAALLKRGRGFTREDLGVLLALSREASAGVLDRFKRAREEGVVHLTTTPYYHPILPLVIDGASAHEATSDGGAPVFSAPDDAAKQIERAALRHEELFGERPRAMWPSEGALSEAAVQLIADAGFEVAASDEELLRHSLGAPDAHDVHLHGWRHEKSGLHLLFRDRALSDDWGFVYRDRPPNDAAQAFVQGIEERRKRGGTLCAVILDGENPFEFYPAAGRDHLRAFARHAKSTLEFVAPEQAVKQSPQRLKHIRTGSWIHASLDIWAGDDEDRRAWELLRSVRTQIDLDKLEPDARAKAEHHLFAAEGSDWFWWYGPEFDIPDVVSFDALFRGHLRAALAAAGLSDDAPALQTPIFRPKSTARGRNCPPWGDVEGGVSRSHLSELQNAAHAGANEDGGAMHRGAAVVEDVYVLTREHEFTVVFSVRHDVDQAQVVVESVLEVAGKDPSETRAIRSVRFDGDKTTWRDGTSRLGRVTFAWRELTSSDGAEARIRVQAEAGPASEVLPPDGLLVRRPSAFAFEA